MSCVGSVAISSMRIERSERFIGYSAAALAATSFAILWVPNLQHASRGVTGATYLAVGVVLAAFLALATLTGRRALVALGALFVTVGPWGPERLFQLLYLALTAWLVVRLALRLRAARVEAASSPVRLPAPTVTKERARRELGRAARAGRPERRSRPVSASSNQRPGTARSADQRGRSRVSARRAALATHT